MNIRSQRGFTLIELLVVIAIIGMLSSVILSSLNGARKKARDARRLADLKEVQAALELYYSDHTAYPTSATQVSATSVLTSALSPTYMSSIPDDPLGGSYHYVYKTTSAGEYYCLGAVIEGTAPASSCNTGSSGLNGDLAGTNLYKVGP